MPIKSRQRAAKSTSRAVKGGAVLELNQPEVAIAYLLKQLHQSLRQAMDDAFRLEQVEVSFPHFIVLYALETEPGITGAELARRSYVTAQSMNALLRNLEDEQLIERRPHPSSARADSWHLTRTGEQALNAGKCVAGGVWSRLLSPLNERDIAQFKDYLQRCVDGMGQAVGTDLPNAARSKKSVRR